MQAHYEISWLTFRPNGTGPALPKIERSLVHDASTGRLLGVLVAEIGALNEVMILHAHDDLARALDARDTRQRRGDLFGVSAELVGFRASTYASFPFVPGIVPAEAGPVFEVREYDVKPGALPALLAAWERALPARVKLSPMATAAYAVDGVQPRMLHIWPYRDLIERGRIRGEAVAQGIWPPPGGADHLVSMRSSIYLPAPFSPLQ